MGFLKSLFGGDKPAPVVAKEMEGKEYSIFGLYSTNFIVPSNVESRNPNYPWTEEKQTTFFWMFAGENFVFDAEVGCMRIIRFDVDRDLKGVVWVSLYKETADEFMAYSDRWGEIPKDIGMLELSFGDGFGYVEVRKHNVPAGQPYLWSNQHAKDRKARSGR
jgi:hypothetical protein